MLNVGFECCRYQQLLAECSPVRLLDLRDMQKQVGGWAAADDEGRGEVITPAGLAVAGGCWGL